MIVNAGILCAPLVDACLFQNSELQLLVVLKTD